MRYPIRSAGWLFWTINEIILGGVCWPRVGTVDRPMFHSDGGWGLQLVLHCTRRGCWIAAAVILQCKRVFRLDELLQTRKVKAAVSNFLWCGVAKEILIKFRDFKISTIIKFEFLFKKHIIGSLGTFLRNALDELYLFICNNDCWYCYMLVLN